jgi:hypothetical protein
MQLDRLWSDVQRLSDVAIGLALGRNVATRRSLAVSASTSGVDLVGFARRAVFSRAAFEFTARPGARASLGLRRHRASRAETRPRRSRPRRSHGARPSRCCAQLTSSHSRHARRTRPSAKAISMCGGGPRRRRPRWSCAGCRGRRSGYLRVLPWCSRRGRPWMRTTRLPVCL